MASTAQISDIELLNFLGLHVLQKEVDRDSASACYSFRLPAEAIPLLKRLSEAEIATLVGNLGQQCMFQLRPELLACADAPTELAAVLAVARNPRAASGQPRRGQAHTETR